MNRNFIAGGLVFFLCLLFPSSMQAASIHWNEAFEQVQPTLGGTYSVTIKDATTGLFVLPYSGAKFSFVGNSYAWSGNTIKEADTPILALPESGTLLLLGIGLAGIAALFRKNQISSGRDATRRHNESPSVECGNLQASEQSRSQPTYL